MCLRIVFPVLIMSLCAAAHIAQHDADTFLAAEEGGCSVELIAAEEASAYAGGGISLGFHTGDVEARRAALAEQGLDPSPITSPNPHVKFFFVRDPDGVQIQFI